METGQLVSKHFRYSSFWRALPLWFRIAATVWLLVAAGIQMGWAFSVLYSNPDPDFVRTIDVWTDTVGFASSAVLAWVAFCARIGYVVNWWHRTRKWRRNTQIALLALVFHMSYFLVTFELTDRATWSRLLIIVAAASWLVVWILEVFDDHEIMLEWTIDGELE